ncbi:MazG-like family protein [Clostridium sp. BJN0001]|uniref:MazG-like family protein n=1 Tax=Clostridium sp. BJN0001 TaxID=2930219 RepID=UPI001FD173ED|nr:MazG-like family protein [Clostridium sp. BJN0001]
MRKNNINIITNVKIIDKLKAQLVCSAGELLRLLAKSGNVARESIIDTIAGAIIILYVLAQRLGYSFAEIDDTINDKLSLGIKSEDYIEKEGKSLSSLKKYINKRTD